MMSKIFYTPLRQKLVYGFALCFFYSNFLVASSNPDSTAQKNINWQNADPNTDNLMGVSTEKTYQDLLKGKKSKKVVVAIIDSGIDVEHEDLKSNIWINEDEIPGNGIDDDKNGYVDDIHGWNFLGNSKGENIVQETYEMTRICATLEAKYKDKKAKDIAKKDKAEYEMYIRAKKEYEAEYNDAKATVDQLNGFMKKYNETQELLKKHLNKATFTLDDLNNIKLTDNNDLNNAVAMHKRLLQNNFSMDDYDKRKSHFENNLNFYLNKNFNPRLKIGDDVNNFKDSIYGNNDVKGGGAEHGTHVAGIVGAVRNNDKGLNGIAENVKLMAVRVVPDGDECDKDIANGIRYAVNNGAQILNMSFGKTFSPNSKYVYEALKYAQDRGVLMVQAAGNSSENIDKVTHYPTANPGQDLEPIKSIICVGASANQSNHTLRGYFSNYGKKTVDIFAPGVNIFSSIPDNKYDSYNGTSMASPVVAGVAALLWSYYPNLTALQVKDILINSSVNLKKTKVIKPNTNPMKMKTVRFGKLSKHGALVNAYQAVKMAEELYKQK